MKFRRKKGASLFLAVMVITMLSIIVGAMGTMARLNVLGGQAMVVTDDIFFIAESGIETGIDWLRNKDTDLNWYNNYDSSGLSEPNLTYTLATDKTVLLSVRYPATSLSSEITSTLLPLSTQSVQCFSEYGAIQSGEKFYVTIPPDIIKINSFNSSTQQLLLDSPDSFTTFVNNPNHQQTEKVYPVTLLTSNLSATDTTLLVGNTRGFLPAGTLKLWNSATGASELIRYNNKTKTSFLGCQRASNGTQAVAALTSEKWRIVPVDYEATIYSTGTTQGLSKTLEVTVQYKDWE